MAINKITANALVKSQAAQAAVKSKLNLNNKDKATPVKSDGYMLPSRIFGSPKRYINNLKNDFVTIKKGAAGQANDHELGRLNDLAMKAGSLLLAAYLFTTKPFKTSKAMEFVGFGTFFASMALWPKLFIQAPIKARTGVDIHRKYVDSFGREKMFFQDPQYIPWSLMDQKEIDKMGDKLNIPKDTPNRNAVIQDTARKTAVQGNTLWMYTAGMAAPVMSALACNVLEPKVDGAIRNATLRSTKKHLENSSLTFIQRIKQNIDLRKAHKFLQGMENQTLDEATINAIAKRFGNSDHSLEKALVEKLSALAQSKKSAAVPLTQEILDKVLMFGGKEAVPGISLDKVVSETGIREVSGKTIGVLAEHISKLAFPADEFDQQTARTLYTETLGKIFETERMPKVGVVSETLGKLADTMSHLKAKMGILDRFLTVRTKQIPGTQLGTQYNEFNRAVIDALGLGRPSKKLLSDDEIIRRIEGFVGSDKFEGTVQTLGSKIETFHRDLGTAIVHEKLDETLMAAGKKLKEANMGDVADKLTGKKVSLSHTLEFLGLKKVPVTRERINYAVQKALEAKQDQALAEAVKLDTQISAFGDADKLKRVIDTAFEGQHGTMRRAVRSKVEMRVLGAECSLYRVMHTFDIFKRIKSGKLLTQLQECGLKESEIPVAIEYAKKFITGGTIADHSDKARYMGTANGKKIHDAVMRVLFDDEKFPTEIGSDLLKARLRVYKKEAKSAIVDIMQRMEGPDKEGWLAGTLEHMKGITKHNIVGDNIIDSVGNGVQNIKNSNKWLKIFGSAFLVLVGITLIAGTQFGKQKKTQEAEKAGKLEKGEKTNG